MILVEAVACNMYGIFTVLKPTALAQVKCINAFVKQRCLFVLNLPLPDRCENYCSHHKLVIMFPRLSDTKVQTPFMLQYTRAHYDTRPVGSNVIVLNAVSVHSVHRK